MQRRILQDSSGIPAGSLRRPDRNRLIEQAEALVGHPDFDGSMRDFCRGLSDFYALQSRGDGLFETISWSVAVLVLHLGATESGVNASQLVSMCCRGGLAGRVATQNAIHALRNRGMIEIDGAAARGAAQRLRATPKLAGRMREELSVRLQAMSPVIPWPAPAAEFALAPDVVRTFLAGNIVAYREFDFVLYSGFPEVKSFMDRRHGYVVLLHVLSRTEAAGRFALATTPPSEIAMRFDVSRAHVRKLFAAAAARGWLSCARGGRIDFDAGVYDRLRLWIALEFAWTRWLLLESA